MDAAVQSINQEHHKLPRLECVDAFRGFVMARMLIGVPLIPAVACLPEGWFREVLNQQLHHSAWNGLTWVDFSFAGYVMLMGLGIALAARPNPDGTPRTISLSRMAQRTCVLFFLGLFYNGGVSQKWPHVRIAGVLQRMALCYFAGALIYSYCSKQVRYALLSMILVGYWAVMTFVPVPGGTAGDFTFDGNLAAWVDARFLPGEAFFGKWDPEGILTTIPAIASCLVGTIWGDLLLSHQSHKKKLLWLFVGGVLALNCGLIFDSEFPINKSLWTSSYILTTAGIGSIILGVFYVVADIIHCGRWLLPLIVIGRNVLLTFLVLRMIPMDSLAQRLVGGDVAACFGPWSPFVSAATESLMVWLLLYWLYKNDLVVKV